MLFSSFICNHNNGRFHEEFPVLDVAPEAKKIPKWD